MSSEAPPRIETVRETIQEGLEDAVLKALAKVPADRFSTAADFSRALVEAGPDGRTGT